MRNRIPALNGRLLGQAALVILIAAASAACSNSKRFSEPFFTGSTDNQRQIVQGGSSYDNYQPMPAQVASNGAISRSALPPPPATSYQPQQYASASADLTGAGGNYAWTAQGGQVVNVGPGDTLDNLAAKYGVPQEQILSANQLTSSSQVRNGAQVIIPRRVSGASVASAPMPAQVPATAYAPPAPQVQESPTFAATDGGTYVVQAGDTLYGIARRNGVRVNDLIALNGLASPESIRVGQTLRLGGSAGGAPMVASAPATLGAPEKPLGQLRVTAGGEPLAAGAAVASAPAAGPAVVLPSPADSVAMNAPAAPQIPANAGAPVATNASVTADIDAGIESASSDGKSFRWPVRGRIISGFGAKPNGERNEGINLAVPEGTSVKAAEAGEVIYAGNELAGYGNLILVRHADGWVSAYAHNKELLVKRGETVRRGQSVAVAGMSGSVSSPQVHFELRKGSKPVNPLDYLAGT